MKIGQKRAGIVRVDECRDRPIVRISPECDNTTGTQRPKKACGIVETDRPVLHNRNQMRSRGAHTCDRLRPSLQNQIIESHPLSVNDKLQIPTDPERPNQRSSLTQKGNDLIITVVRPLHRAPKMENVAEQRKGAGTLPRLTPDLCALAGKVSENKSELPFLCRTVRGWIILAPRRAISRAIA